MQYYTIFVYDIVDNNKRAKIYRLMKKYSIPVQKSVYEAIADDKLIGLITSKVSKIIDKNNDNLRIYKFKSLNNIMIDNIGQERHSPFEDNSDELL